MGLKRLQAFACGALGLVAATASLSFMAVTAVQGQPATPAPQSAPSQLPPANQAGPLPVDPPAQPIGQVNSGSAWRILKDRWSEADEREYSDFIARIGESGCSNVNRCMWDKANPFANTNPKGAHFYADCADLPYFLRAYFAWKKGLPFTYINAVSPKGSSRDIRYTLSGNRISGRRTVVSGESGPAVLSTLRGLISSAMFRLHPKDEGTDLYPVAINPKSIRPGTVLYDPNGHLAVVYKVEKDGRVRFIDAHPDNSLTRATYGRKFVRSRPSAGAGFKNWRPFTMVGGTPQFVSNANLPDFSVEQFYGNADNPPSDSGWQSGRFLIDGENVDYYDYVRIQMAGGSLTYDPIAEMRAMVRTNCEDIKYRGEAVQIAIAAGIQNKGQPGSLPRNIYGTDGEWEEYSTPSRDARLKTSFKELRDQIQFLVEEHRRGNKRVVYSGTNLIADLLAAYDQEAAACSITYNRTDGSPVTLGYEEVRKRLFLLSFDPYHCVERRWGASDAAELATCRDGAEKRAWYDAEQGLRNQIDRTYEARMDHSLEALRTPGGEGKGVATPPDVDIRGYLQRELTQPMAPAGSPQSSLAPQTVPGGQAGVGLTPAASTAIATQGAVAVTAQGAAAATAGAAAAADAPHRRATPARHHTISATGADEPGAAPNDGSNAFPNSGARK